MKKKITLLALMLVLVSALVAVLAFAVSADDAIVVRYADYAGKQRAAATPNADGSYTLRTEKLSGNGTVTLANGTKVDKVFYGWFTKDGTFYEPGATVTFTESTDIFEAYGIEVNTAEDLAAVKINNYVRIGADLTIDFELKSDWGTSIYDLNGHTLTSTNKNHAIYNYRGATVLIGKGKLIHTPSTVNTKDNETGGIIYQHHGYGDTSNPQLCWIGKDVEFETPYNFIRTTNSPNHTNMPNVEVFGKITAKNFIRAGVLVNSTVIFHSSADVALNGTTFFDCTATTGTDAYMNLTVGGTIKLTNSDALFFSDFLMTNLFGISTVTNGSFTVSSADAERIAMFLPDTLMLKATENADGTTTYNVTEADCIHDWVLDTEATVAPTPGVSGLDVFKCSKCKTGKQTITVYSPSSAEITVVVRTEEGDKEYTVLAGDVYDFQYNGIGAAALCYIAGLKDTADFTADKIISIEVPAGVAEFTGFDNSTLEAVSILDGATVKVYTLDKLTALKTINVGKAEVTFTGLVKSTVEKISSKVEGAKLTFENNCFYKGASIKSLEMCAGSTYKFGTNSFRECGLTELILPDNSTISWGNNAFAECQQLEYIYIGSNIGVKTINKDSAIFDGISNLKKVVIMDLTYLGQWAFSTKEQGKDFGPKCDLAMYIHSEALTMDANAFNNRKGNYHVFIYTVQTTLPSTINNCNRVIYQGIGHAYTSDTIVPSTCVTPGTAGYVTDCPCGIDYRENAYTTYSSYDNSLNNVTHEPFGTATFELPLSTEHTDSDIVNNVVFTNGYMSLGTKSYKCLYCDVTIKTEEEASFPALFEYLGYSTPEDGTLALSVGYSVNVKAVSDYEEITDINLEYGAVAAIAEKLGGKAPFDESLENVPVVKASVNKDYVAFDFVISGFTDAQLDLALVMCAYVYDGTKYVYLQKTQVENPVAVSINSILASK